MSRHHHAASGSVRFGSVHSTARTDADTGKFHQKQTQGRSFVRLILLIFQNKISRPITNKPYLFWILTKIIHRKPVRAEQDWKPHKLFGVLIYSLTEGTTASPAAAVPKYFRPQHKHIHFV